MCVVKREVANITLNIVGVNVFIWLCIILNIHNKLKGNQTTLSEQKYYIKKIQYLFHCQL